MREYECMKRIKYLKEQLGYHHESPNLYHCQTKIFNSCRNQTLLKMIRVMCYPHQIQTQVCNPIISELELTILNIWK